MKRLIPIVLIVIALAASACDSEGGITTTVAPGETTTTEAPQETTTTAPAETTTTEAPQETTTTAPAGEESPDEGDDDAPWWLLIVVWIALLVVVVALVRKGSRKKAAPTPSPQNWKAQARSAYADTRWLYDAMTEDLAVWRGNAQFDGTSTVGASAATSQAEAWARLSATSTRASSDLYQLEATAPDNRSRAAARFTIETMNQLRTDLDARAEARYAYRKAEADGVDAPTLVAARDREVRASRNLTDARNRYAAALSDLAMLV